MFSLRNTHNLRVFIPGGRDLSCVRVADSGTGYKSELVLNLGRGGVSTTSTSGRGHETVCMCTQKGAK